MGKFVFGKELAALQEAKAKWDVVSAFVVDKVESATADALTGEDVVEYLQGAVDAKQKGLEELVSEQRQELEMLREQVKSLQGSPSPQLEPKAGVDDEPANDLASFLVSNKGDYVAIVNRLKLDGII